MNKLILSFLLILFVRVQAVGQYSGTGPITLKTPAGVAGVQWYKDGAAISGATSTSYVAATAGTYNATYSDGTTVCSADQSAQFVLLAGGSTVTLNGTTNNGSGTNYQWNNAGTPISGANLANYTTGTGGLYTLTYNNGTCTVTSKPYYVFVLTPLLDSDGDGITDDVDLDDDNDGILDTVECKGYSVYMTHYALAGSLPTNVPYIISGAASTSVLINQNGTPYNDITYNSFTWKLLASGVQPSATGTISVSLVPDATTNGSYVFADAILISDGTSFTVIDNNSVSGTNGFNFSAGWSYQATGYNNSNTFATPSYVGKWASWTAGGLAPIACDTDGDGIANNLDLDSDGDGCPDAIEGGGPFTTANLVTSTMAGGSTNVKTNLGNTVSTAGATYGVPTVAGAGQSLGYALNATINACLDSDNDGILDIDDLDDDNDGILDTAEIPCTGAVMAKTGVTVASDLTFTYNGPLNLGGLVDGQDAIYVQGPTGNFANSTWLRFNLPAPKVLTQIELGHFPNQTLFSVGGSYKMQGSNNGANWTDIGTTQTYTNSPPILAVNNSAKFDMSGNTTAYQYYRVFGISGSSGGGWGNELYFLERVCGNADIDGDGIANNLDLDSDGDGCPDAVEGGGPFITANLVTSTMAGGPSNVTKNLGTSVSSATATYGVPVIAGAGQSMGFSQNATFNGCLDSDGDGIPDDVDLDDDNDGILDTLESVNCSNSTSSSISNGASGTNCTLPAAPALGIRESGCLGWYSTNGNFDIYSYSGTPPLPKFDLQGTSFGSPTGSAYGQGLLYGKMQKDYSTSAGKQYTFTEMWAGGSFITLGDACLLQAIDLATNTVLASVTVNAGSNTSINFTALSNTTKITLGYNVGSNNSGFGSMFWTPLDLVDASTGLAAVTYCDIDTDGDGIPNRLDLDSDGDGCSDAVEGGAAFTNVNLVASSMPGGNSGASYTGTSSTPVTQNLGTNVSSATATFGVPILAGAGQTVGTSVSVTVQDAACVPLPTLAITGPINTTVNGPTVPISGTATPLASVTVSGPNGQTCVTTASAAGSWTCSSLTFAVGSQTVTAVASNTAGVSTPATASFTVVCAAGTTAPALSATSKTNVCSATTVDLSTITASSIPVGAILFWFNSPTPSAATKLSSLTVASSGVYYAAFQDAANTCYSPVTAVTVTITNCALPPTIAITTPNNVTTTNTNPPISGTTAALASVTVTTPNGQTCITTANASGNWTCTSLTFTVGAQTVTAVASNTAGASTVATSSFTVVCAAGTTAPTLSATTKANACPATTVDLSTITASNTPPGATLTWHSGTPATSANKLSSITSLTAGTYYAAFFDATNNCYSGTGSAVTPVTATTVACTQPCSVSLASGGLCSTLTPVVTNGTAPFTYTWTGPTMNVTAVTKDATHPYFGVGSAMGFAIDGVQGKELVLVRGVTYSFNVNTPGHPFVFTNSPVGGSTNTAQDITTGVTNSGATSGTMTFTPSASTPNLIYYNCDVHQNMGWKIHIIDQLPNGVIVNAMPGTYSLMVMDAGTCMSTTTVTVSSTCTPACSASVAPLLTVASKANVCPATTIDLSTVTATNTPASTTLTWHTGTPATAANEITAISSLTAGTYYAAFKGLAGVIDCYGATTPVIASTGSCCPNPSVGGVTSFTGNPLCTLSNAGAVTLSGQTGSVVKWQTSINGGLNWTDIANTVGLTSYGFVNAVNNQQFRAMVNNGGSCGDANSTAITVTTSSVACTVNCNVLPSVIVK